MQIPKLDIRNLTIKFGDFKAVDNISFSVGKGEIFGFLGANGAGKTTTIRALCGLINISQGAIFIDGLDMTKKLSSIKKTIGYMSQKFTLYQDLSVKENMLFSGALYSMAKEDVLKRMDEILKYTGFKGADAVVKNLSGGEKQIAALCASMLHNPDIIFLDEPTAAVSPVSRKLFWDLIRKLSQNGKTIFVTTHYMDEAEFCGRIALMQSGRIIAMDNPAALIKNSSAEDLEGAFIKIIKEKK
jgi:ABC-2 type transport system ATP-binding protein